MKIAPLLAFALAPLAAFSQMTGVSLDAWKTSLPFSFTYDGKDSSAFLRGWKRTEETGSWPGGQIQRCIFTDPVTKLEVSAELRTFSDFDAIDWVLRFSNGGEKDTPIIENIEPLDWTLPAQGDCVLHHARGSKANIDDFGPLTDAVSKGRTVQIGSTTGRPSTTSLPFFNLEERGGGLLGGLGWTGEWSATFAADPSGRTIRMTAGMQRTHLLLHPGEQIRTPRIVLLNWRGGDWLDAQNLWRRFLLAHYSPRAGGQPVTGPVCYGTWGTDPIANKLAQVAMIKRERLPFDVYWIDAGWYGNSEGNGDEGAHPWWRFRGSWWPNPAPFPNGLKPLGDAVRAAGLGFLLWFEPEEGDPGTTLRTEHPGWFFYPANFSNPGTAILNLGNPDARKGITALISKYVTDAGLAWYRQDFNVNPAPAWAAADTPDRIGMSEIRDVEGLYAFWDQLAAEHPGLLIDNCASGGQRLDLETLSRSFPLWRSDEPRFAIGSQMQTQGLAQWVPLNGGVGWTDPGPFTDEVTPPPKIDSSLLYVIRSGYSAALVFGMGSAQGKTQAWCGRLRKLIGEYREVQPYTYGDFYPLLPYSLTGDCMAALQWNRPDKNAGVIVALRRPDCTYSGIQIMPRAIDPAAHYEVEIRTGLEKEKSKTMPGAELAHLRVEISEKPGSALVFYRKL